MRGELLANDRSAEDEVGVAFLQRGPLGSVAVVCLVIKDSRTIHRTGGRTLPWRCGSIRRKRGRRHESG